MAEGFWNGWEWVERPDLPGISWTSLCLRLSLLGREHPRTRWDGEGDVEVLGVCKPGIDPWAVLLCGSFDIEVKVASYPSRRLAFAALLQAVQFYDSVRKTG